MISSVVQFCIFLNSVFYHISRMSQSSFKTPEKTSTPLPDPAQSPVAKRGRLSTSAARAGTSGHSPTRDGEWLSTGAKSPVRGNPDADGYIDVIAAAPDDKEVEFVRFANGTFFQNRSSTPDFILLPLMRLFLDYQHLEFSTRRADCFERRCVEIRRSFGIHKDGQLDSCKQDWRWDLDLHYPHYMLKRNSGTDSGLRHVTWFDLSQYTPMISTLSLLELCRNKRRNVKVHVVCRHCDAFKVHHLATPHGIFRIRSSCTVCGMSNTRAALLKHNGLYCWFGYFGAITASAYGAPLM